MSAGATCRGEIVRQLPGPGCPAEYAYSVAGVPYTAVSSLCQVRPGRQVTVTYLPDDPAQSCIGSPARQLADEATGHFFGGLSFPALD